MKQEYKLNDESSLSIKEQLRLFAYDIDAQATPLIIERVNKELSTKERLSILLDGELDFHGENSRYASHDLHAFAAKFPPQLPRVFIRGLTKPNDIVLDPMMGSGTTIVESHIEGRIGMGLDIDPLSLQLSTVKVTPLDIDRLQKAGESVMERANQIIRFENEAIEKYLNNFDESTKEFINYWFLQPTQNELTALYLAIQEIESATIKRFLELTFSSIIITKSGGVSRARDLAHSRPHLDKLKNPKNAIDQFAYKLRRNIKSISEINRASFISNTIGGDAKLMPIANESIDLIVTSPPYANAIDYMRAHKFSLVWSGKKIRDLTELRSRYIGSERLGDLQPQYLGEHSEKIIQLLTDRDKKKAAILRKYLTEMRSVISEMYRVLQKDSVAIIVIGTSTMRDLDIETHLCLADIAQAIGFELVRISKRVLDRNKRMMPARFGKTKGSNIEQRIHEEYVIGLLKN